MNSREAALTTRGNNVNVNVTTRGRRRVKRAGLSSVLLHTCIHSSHSGIRARERKAAFAAPLLRDGAAGKGSRQGEGRRAEQVGAQPDDAAAAGLVLVLIHFYRLYRSARYNACMQSGLRSQLQ